MADLPTRLDLFAIGRDYVLQRAKKIDPTNVDVEGTDVNIFVGSLSVLAYYLINQLAFSIANLTLDGSEGEELDRFAYDRYQLTRPGATSALGQVRFFRTIASGGAGSIPANTLLTTNTGVQYITTTTATFGGSTLEVFADVRATQAGKETQVGANTIRRFSSPETIFDPNIQINNDLPTAGGENAFEDEEFRALIRQFWRTVRRGTLGAIEFGALSTPGVVSAQAVESLEPTGEAARIVELYIADSSGVANTQLAAQVKTVLNEFRAAGINVLISNSIPKIVNIRLKLNFVAGVNTTQLTEEIRNSVVAFVNSLSVNGPLYVAALSTVFIRFQADGLIADEGSILEPVGDLLPSPGETLRTTLNNVVVI
jgi:uncharacterized phage protein gp47/JayE